jgi:PAS domain S-box-containing protein
MSASAARSEIEELQRRLNEAEETLRAIRSGEVDALVVETALGARVFTLEGADHPYRALIESMHQGAVSLNPDGMVLYCNSSFAGMLKRSHERVVGASAIDFVWAPHQPAFAAMLRDAATRGSHGELQFQTHEGGLLPAFVALNPLPLSGSTALCMVVTDLTEHKQNQDLQDANQRKDEFLAMLGHELRNPLAGILNGVEVLVHLGLPEGEVAEMCGVIQRQGILMRHIVDDLLDVTRMTRGKIVLKKEPIELVQFLREVVDDHRRQLEADGARLQLVLPSEPVWCDADRTRLSQIVGNLLANSAKFLDRAGDITVAAWSDPARKRAVVSVRDTGVGMDGATLERIFQPFVQAESTLDRSRGGLGLGLALVKGLVELHGGRVIATSPGIGRGSEFTIELPALAEQGQDAAIEQPRPRGLPRRVLLIDDRRDAILPVRKMLELAGHEVFTAADGAGGVALARAIRPEVVFCDIGLPDGMSGYDVAAAVRRDLTMGGIYLVALSGYGQEEDRRRSQEAGFDYHLTKPVSIVELEDLIGRLPRFAGVSAK